MAYFLEPKEEKVIEIMGNEYVSAQGKLRGVYETVDDAFLLVNVNVFDKAVNDGVIVRDMSLEDAEEKYGQLIIEKYLKQQEELRQSRQQMARQKNMANARSVKELSIHAKRVNVLKEVMMGYSVNEIIDKYGYPKSTVYDFLKIFSLDKQMVLEIYKKELEHCKDIPVAYYQEFMRCDCDYKKFREFIEKEKKEETESVARRKEKWSKAYEFMEEVKKEPKVVSEDNFIEELMSMSQAQRKVESKGVLAQEEELPDYLFKKPVEVPTGDISHILSKRKQVRPRQTFTEVHN